MPWRPILKTVKGHQYAYLQRSFREGGRVRTESRYLGPADKMASFSPPTAPAGNSEAGFVVTTPPDGLRFRFSPESRNLDGERIQREYARVREWAQGLGVPTKTFPKMVLRQGKESGFRRSWRGGGFVVSMGKDEGRKAGRAAFADAMGQAFLDGIRSANPLAFQALEARLDPSFRTTSRLVFQALATDGERSRLALTLQISAFGIIHRATGLPAESIGLAHYGKRKSWEDEAAAIIGEVATQGFRHAQQRRDKAIADAYAREHRLRRKFQKTKLFDRITGKRRAIGRQLVGATAARMAAEEARQKLHLLAQVVPEITPRN
jgi:hypothetical protein